MTNECNQMRLHLTCDFAFNWWSVSFPTKDTIYASFAISLFYVVNGAFGHTK